MNDYGFELTSDVAINAGELCSLIPDDPEEIRQGITKAIHAASLQKRRFREIARISGLIFEGVGSQKNSAKYLQASSELFFEVFEKHEPDNLLLQQALREVINIDLEGERLVNTIQDLKRQHTIVPIKKPTPFAVPLIAERLRASLSSEQFEKRMKKMVQQLERKND
jgi:ATP-dependent Lhr-like helicase